MCQDEGGDGKGLAEGSERVQVSFLSLVALERADG